MVDLTYWCELNQGKKIKNELGISGYLGRKEEEIECERAVPILFDTVKSTADGAYQVIYGLPLEPNNPKFPPSLSPVHPNASTRPVAIARLYLIVAWSRTAYSAVGRAPMEINSAKKTSLPTLARLVAKLGHVFLELIA